MRRTTALLIAITAGAVLLGSAERAAAQRTVYDYDDYRAWWDSFNCDEMKTLLIAKKSESTAGHEKRVCGMSDNLAPADLLILQTFIAATMATGHADHKTWWSANSVANRQALAGRVAISGENQSYKEPSEDSNEGDYSEEYDRLRPEPMARVVKSADALSGQSAMKTTDDEEEAPALPLAGIAILGMLLAGRGWWLRRRQ